MLKSLNLKLWTYLMVHISRLLTFADLRRPRIFFSTIDQSCCVFSIHSRAFINPDHREIILSLNCARRKSAIFSAPIIISLLQKLIFNFEQFKALEKVAHVIWGIAIGFSTRVLDWIRRNKKSISKKIKNPVKNPLHDNCRNCRFWNQNINIA